MMPINLVSKGWCVFGLRGSGKSELVKQILSTTRDHMVYDPLDEHEGRNRYVPTDRESVKELDEFIRGIVIPRKPALCVIDEANKYIQPKPTRLPPGVADLNDFARHWGISCGYVARRPVQFHTDIVELANFAFFFHLPGKNDYAYMEGIYQGLGDQVRALEKYHFVILEEGQSMTVHSPVDISTKPVQNTLH